MKVEIDDSIFEVLEARAAEKEYEDTNEYIEHLLKQVVRKIKKEKEAGESSYSEEEEQKVKDRLRDLGYLD